MKYDADYYCCKNFVPKFKALLDARYSKLKEHKRRSEFEKEYLDIFQKDKEINNISSSVRQWFAYQQKPSIEKLMNICELLDCDIDYFLTEQEEFKKDVASAAIEIGLKYTSTEKIKNYSHETKDLLDRMIMHLNGDNLLKLLKSIYIYSLETHHSNVQLDVIGADRFQTNEINAKLITYTDSPGSTLPDISKRMLKYAVTSALDEILTDTYNDYIEDGNVLLKKRLNKKAEREKTRCSYLLKKRAELKERGEELPNEELFFLLDVWGDGPFPTESEIHKRIDKKYNDLYDFYKE